MSDNNKHEPIILK